MTREQAKERADGILGSLCSRKGCCVSNVDTIAQALIQAHNDAIEAAAMSAEHHINAWGHNTAHFAARDIRALKIGAPE